MATSFLIPTITLTITLLLSFLSPTTSFVYDTKGNPLINGGTYYIIPNNPGSNPLTYTTLTRPTSTPFLITQSGQNNLKPTLVRIRLSSPIFFLYITVSTPVILEFVDPNPHPFCKNLHWFLSLENISFLRGPANVCGQNGEKNQLIIDEIKGSNDGDDKNKVYNLSFCYNDVNGGCPDRLKLGMLEYGRPDNLYLGFNPSNPLPFVFQKVEEESPSII